MKKLWLILFASLLITGNAFAVEYVIGVVSFPSSYEPGAGVYEPSFLLSGINYANNIEDLNSILYAAIPPGVQPVSQAKIEITDSQGGAMTLYTEANGFSGFTSTGGYAVSAGISKSGYTIYTLPFSAPQANCVGAIVCLFKLPPRASPAPANNKIPVYNKIQEINAPKHFKVSKIIIKSASKFRWEVKRKAYPPKKIK